MDHTCPNTVVALAVRSTHGRPSVLLLRFKNNKNGLSFAKHITCHRQIKQGMCYYLIASIFLVMNILYRLKIFFLNGQIGLRVL